MAQKSQKSVSDSNVIVVSDRGGELSAAESFRVRVRLVFLEDAIKEVDDMIRKYIQLHFREKCVNRSSWKFPNKKLSDVNVEEYLHKQNSIGLSIENRYFNITETLIDRLYFGITVFEMLSQELVDQIELKIRGELPLNNQSFLVFKKSSEQGSSNIGAATKRALLNLTNLKKRIDEYVELTNSSVSRSETELESSPKAKKNSSVSRSETELESSPKAKTVAAGKICPPKQKQKDACCQALTTLYDEKWVDDTFEAYESQIASLRLSLDENFKEFETLYYNLSEYKEKRAVLITENDLLRTDLAYRGNVIRDLERRLTNLVGDNLANEKYIRILEESNVEKQETIDHLEKELKKAKETIEELKLSPDN